MSASEKNFFISVERMRICQKECFRTRCHSALLTAKKCETEVDKYIKEKRSEWAQKLQPEIF